MRERERGRERERCRSSDVRFQAELYVQVVTLQRASSDDEFVVCWCDEEERQKEERTEKYENPQKDEARKNNLKFRYYW
jgi:hypothetical protein